MLYIAIYIDNRAMDIKPDLMQLQQAQEMMNAAAVMQAQQQQQGAPPGYNPYGFGMSPLHSIQSPHSSMGSPPSLGSPGKVTFRPDQYDHGSKN